MKALSASSRVMSSAFMRLRKHALNRENKYSPVPIRA